eukprot:scaffold6845_cov207-Skeletonema_marinoi.AAC.4
MRMVDIVSCGVDKAACSTKNNKARDPCLLKLGGDILIPTYRYPVFLFVVVKSLIPRLPTTFSPNPPANPALPFGTCPKHPKHVATPSHTLSGPANQALFVIAGYSNFNKPARIISLVCWRFVGGGGRANSITQHLRYCTNFNHSSSLCIQRGKEYPNITNDSVTAVPPMYKYLSVVPSPPLLICHS